MEGIYRPVFKTTLGVGPPIEGLLFGEASFADGSDTLYIGKANGKCIAITANRMSDAKEIIDLAFNDSFEDIGNSELVVMPELRMGMLNISASSKTAIDEDSVIATIPIAYSALSVVSVSGIATKADDNKICAAFFCLDGNSIRFKSSYSNGSSYFTLLAFSITFNY